MARYLFILVALLALVVGCKGGGSASDNDNGTDADVDTGADVDGFPDADCPACASYHFTVKIDGTITNEQGTPISGIAVALYDDGEERSPRAFSNEEGKWSIEHEFGDCGGYVEGVIDAKVVATDVDGGANGIYIETVTDFAPWDTVDSESVPPCAKYNEYLEESGVQVVMQAEQPDDDENLPDVDEYPDADCMQCATYSFTIKLGGTVTNEGGAPVQGIAVSIYDNEVTTEPQAISDVEGKWSIETSLGKCGGVPESSVDAKVIAVDIDDEANGVYVETVTDFSPWNVHNEEWKPPCADYDVYLEELGIQVVMQSEQPDDDTLLTDVN